MSTADMYEIWRYRYTHTDQNILQLKIITTIPHLNIEKPWPFLNIAYNGRIIA